MACAVGAFALAVLLAPPIPSGRGEGGPATVVILGGGIVGTNAAKVAAGLRARVTILDIDLDRLRYLDDIMPTNVTTRTSNSYNIREELHLADLGWRKAAARDWPTASTWSPER